MSSEAVLENPQVFDPTAVINQSVQGAVQGQEYRYSQVQMTEQYLELCKEYPPRHFKTIRSHCMRFLYRYFEVHVDLRTAVVNSHFYFCPPNFVAI